MKCLIGMPLGADSRAGMPKSAELGLNPGSIPLWLSPLHWLWEITLLGTLSFPIYKLG